MAEIVHVGTNENRTAEQMVHKCRLPANAEEGVYWRCAECGKWWGWFDSRRIGAHFMTGWLLL